MMFSRDELPIKSKSIPANIAFDKNIRFLFFIDLRSFAHKNCNIKVMLLPGCLSLHEW